MSKRPITVWERYSKKDECFKHNHLEEGWVKTDKPEPICGQDWSMGTWRRFWMYLDENNCIV